MRDLPAVVMLWLSGEQLSTRAIRSGGLDMSKLEQDVGVRTQAAQGHRRRSGPGTFATGQHVLPPLHDDEAVAGYGVMGVPFASGHVLALRVWPAVSFAAGYNAVWHRGPTGRWVMWSDGAPAFSCGRFFSAGVEEVRIATIEVTWPDPWNIEVRVPGEVDWTITLGTSLATRTMTAMSGMLPEPAWRSDGFLAMMGRMSRPMLRAGKVRMQGRVPNGQWFQMAPRRLWPVIDSQALVGVVDLGRPGPLSEQVGLGDFLLPQRGLLALGSVRLEAFDPSRHVAPSRSM